MLLAAQKKISHPGRMTVFEVIREELGIAERPWIYEPALSVVEDESLKPINVHHGQPYRSLGQVPNQLQTYSLIERLTIKASQELFLKGNRNCVHLDFDIVGPSKSFTIRPEITLQYGL